MAKTVNFSDYNKKGKERDSLKTPASGFELLESFFVRPEVQIIRKHIAGLMGFHLGEPYYTALSSFQEMENNEFLKLAENQFDTSGETDWGTHPQYYIALIEHYDKISPMSKMGMKPKKISEETKNPKGKTRIISMRVIRKER